MEPAHIVGVVVGIVSGTVALISLVKAVQGGGRLLERVDRIEREQAHYVRRDVYLAEQQGLAERTEARAERLRDLEHNVEDLRREGRKP